MSDHLSNFWHLTSASSQSAKPLPISARPSNRKTDWAGQTKGFFTCHPELLRNQETSWDREGARPSSPITRQLVVDCLTVTAC